MEESKVLSQEQAKIALRGKLTASTLACIIIFVLIYGTVGDLYGNGWAMITSIIVSALAVTVIFNIKDTHSEGDSQNLNINSSPSKSTSYYHDPSYNPLLDPSSGSAQSTIGSPYYQGDPWE
ncbi:hypothetical protein N8865_01045 [Francisellaceae bacterium]|nr:hypothetical protein [Francisellaceae bacterium]